MPRLTQVQRDELKQLVTDCIIRRLTTKEIQRRIKQELDMDISFGYLLHIRADIKKDSKRQISIYQKDRYAYLDETFFDRAKELKLSQKILHEIIDNEENNDEVRIKALSELKEITVLLANLYEMLPVAMTGPTSLSSSSSLDNSINDSNNITTTSGPVVEDKEYDSRYSV